MGFKMKKLNKKLNKKSLMLLYAELEAMTLKVRNQKLKLSELNFSRLKTKCICNSKSLFDFGCQCGGA